MIVPRVTPIDEPRELGPHELFFSLTDPRGIIRYGNRVFTRVAGYTEEELIGEPHNIIRHPDVPRCVFRLLWDYLAEGKTIGGYVKNLAKDGRYYWVFALATPCPGGYLSVRLNPSTPYFEAASPLYRDTLVEETKWESAEGKKAAIERSLPRLLEGLQGLGFKTYDEFMHTALRAELMRRPTPTLPEQRPRIADLPRHDQILWDLRGVLVRVCGQLKRVFSALDATDTLNDRLIDKRASMAEIGPSLSFLSLNTGIAASRLGPEGAILSVISRSLRENSRDATQSINRLLDCMAPMRAASRQIMFDVAVAELQAEVCESFVGELLGPETDHAHTLVSESLGLLVDQVIDRCDAVFRSVERLGQPIECASRTTAGLIGHVEHMGVAQMNGRIDIASRKNAAGFLSIFEDIRGIIDEAREDCDGILELLREAGGGLNKLRDMEPTLSGDLKSADAMRRELAVV